MSTHDMTNAVALYLSLLVYSVLNSTYAKKGDQKLIEPVVE